MENYKTHPLETILNIEEGEFFNNKEKFEETMSETLPTIVAPTEVVHVESPPKDEEDIAIDKNIDTVYDKALTAFNSQTEMVEIVDPRYAARTAEVAATYLNIALNAMAVKSKVKSERARRGQAGFVPYANSAGAKTINNNLIVADRNDILKMMIQDDKKFDKGE
ncbi:MAG: hypothetical protein QXG00_04645 [Candidatus Woesearchaeota archaeon]